MTVHSSCDGIEEDDDGFMFVSCDCGEYIGPAPDRETMLDMAMEHAWSAGKFEAIEPSHVVIKDEPNHYVTFDDKGWFIEHSIACRIAGTLGTCEFNAAIRQIDEPPPRDEWGRWRITSIDDEGLPSLERA